MIRDGADLAEAGIEVPVLAARRAVPAQPDPVQLQQVQPGAVLRALALGDGGAVVRVPRLPREDPLLAPVAADPPAHGCLPFTFAAGGGRPRRGRDPGRPGRVPAR